MDERLRLVMHAMLREAGCDEDARDIVMSKDCPSRRTIQEKAEQFLAVWEGCMGPGPRINGRAIPPANYLITQPIRLDQPDWFAALMACRVSE